MRSLILSLGAWLFAAPHLFPQTPLAAGEILRYSLEETPEQLTRWLGRPAQIADSDPQHVTWHYQTDVADMHDFSHLLQFRKSDGRLVAVTRNFHIPVNVDALFPAAKTSAHVWPGDPLKKWGVRVRVLGEDRLAIAVGTTKPGELTTQVLIVRRSMLRQFFPWLTV